MFRVVQWGKILLFVFAFMVSCGSAEAVNSSINLSDINLDPDDKSISVNVNIANNDGSTLYVHSMALNYQFSNLKSMDSKTSYECSTDFNNLIWCVGPGKKITKTLTLNLNDETFSRIKPDSYVNVVITNGFSEFLMKNEKLHTNLYYVDWDNEKDAYKFGLKICSHTNNVLKIYSVSADITQKNSKGKTIKSKHCTWENFDDIKALGNLDYWLRTHDFEYVEGATFTVSNVNVGYSTFNPELPYDGYRSLEAAKIGKMLGKSQAQLDAETGFNGWYL